MSDNSRFGIFITKFQGALILSAFLFAGLAFMLALGEMASPCNIAQGQTTCSVGDDETFTGPITIEDEINLEQTPTAGSAGERIRSGGDAVNPEWVFDDAINKTADTSRSTTTTVTADPDLSFTTNVGTDYAIEIVLLANGDAAGDLDFDFTLPSGASIDLLVLTDPVTSAFAYHDNSGETTLETIGSTQVYTIIGHYEQANPALGGTFSFDWAQNTSSGTPTIVEDGSYMRVTELIN